MENLDLLARECRSARNSLFNAIATRKAHPTYGYTKAKLRHQLEFLEGLLYAYHLMATGEASAAHLLQIRQAAENLLGENIDAIRQEVEAA